MTIGKRLAEIRGAQGLNQIDFADALGVAQSTYKNYERGASPPPSALLAQICKTYGIDVQWLLFGTAKPGAVQLAECHRQSLRIAWDYLGHDGAAVDRHALYTLGSALFQWLAERGSITEADVRLLENLLASAREGHLQNVASCLAAGAGGR
jgi:transcriptional regulator with XRE-family HTH domain